MKDKKPGYLEAAIAVTAQSEEMREALKKMSTAMVHSLFTGTAAKAKAATPAPHAFTGLRSVLEADKWKFGTIHKNKITDAYVMAVGYRKVIGLTYPEGDDPTDTVEEWFQYWEAIT